MKYSLKNRCQVCGTIIDEGVRNCDKHRRVQERLSGLVQRIENIDAPLSSHMIERYSIRYECHPSTVRNWLKREGFVAKRTWEKG